MPVRTSYTEATLRPWLVTELGDVATALEWAAGHLQIDAALVDATRLLGVTDVADAPDAGRVERLAAVAAWRRAVKNLGARITVTEDGQKFDQGELQQKALVSLLLAESAAAADLPAYQVRVDTLTYASGDPYAYYPDAARGLP